MLTALERHPGPGPVLTVAAALLLAACPRPPGETQTVGPSGGRLVYPNGVVLEVPKGAVDRLTEITITDLSCDLVEDVLLPTSLQTHAMTCVRGFLAEPDGLTFAVPIRALVPVRPLEAGEIPVQAQRTPDGRRLVVAPTQLTWDGEANVLVLQNITHFTEYWAAVMADFSERQCRHCKTYNLVITDPGKPTYIISDLCEGYAIDVWRSQQNGCCLLLQSERKNCRPDCECCMERLMEVESSGVDATFGECTMLSADVKVRYPYCPDPTPEVFSESGATPECPSNLKLKLRASPTTLTVTIGHTVDLNKAVDAKLTGSTPDAGTVVGPITVLPRWKSKHPAVATVGHDNVLSALNEGSATVVASLSEDPAMPTTSVTVVVKNTPIGSIEGRWHLVPTWQEEQCRYGGLEWWDEEGFGPFDVIVNRPADAGVDGGIDAGLTSDGGTIIAATIPGTDAVLTGAWDPASNAFELAVDTTDPDQCGYLFYGLEPCGDAVDCRFEECRNATLIRGAASRSALTLDADAGWYYSVTFSFETGSGTRGENTYECEGDATLKGTKQ